MVNIPALITETVTLHEDLFKSKNIHVHLAPISDTEVQGNPHDLQQVLTNILLNARDAVADGGNIWISAEENGPRLSIRIKDDGKGIAADMIGKIFEPLVTTKRGQGGTGLGLAITRRILHASDGEVSVESTPGHGAEFTITLPKKTSGSMDQSSGRSESTEPVLTNEPSDPTIH
jgi:two-component system NtrC family sensor kinase